MPEISKTYLAFNTEFKNALAVFASPNFPLYGMTADEVTALQAVYATWETLFNAYALPSRSSGAVKDAAIGYKIARKALSYRQNLIKANTALNLTETQKTAVGVHTDATRRGHVEVPINPAEVSVLGIHLGYAIFQVSILEADGEFDKMGLPTDTDGVLIEWAFTKLNDPAPTEYESYKMEKKSRFRIDFTPEQRGMVCYLKATYVNRRGEKGTTSKPMSIVVN